jgi:signal transduction histidine kinase
MAESQLPDRVNILVVDDLPSQRLTIEVSLTDLGENVVCLPSGREALKFLLENDAAVILLDVNMPGLDGFETATLIRQRPRNANTPIIFLTADPDEMQAARGYALGAVDYVISPFLPEVLRTKVKVFVTLSRANERLRREAEQRVELTREQTARATAEEQSRRLRVLVEAGGVLTRSLDGSGFELELLRLFVPLLADQAGIAFPENGPHRGPPTWIHAANNGSEPLAASRAVPHELVATVESVLATGAATAIPGKNGGGSAGIVMPLGVHGQLYGALAVARLGSGQPYSREDLELLELIAGRTAVALENRRLYRELQERDRRKDEFLATLSHELRNPLGAITTAAQVLQMTVISDGPATHASQVIARQSLHLARIVDDLLEVSRVTAGRIRLSLQPLDLKEVVKRAVDAMRASGRLDPYQVVVTGESVMVEADLARIEQVITNLLVNAVKYTDPGGRIAVQIAAEDDRAVVRVSDTGIGIGPSGWRPRDRPRPGAQAGRASGRHGRSAQPGGRPGKHVRGPAAAPSQHLRAPDEGGRESQARLGADRSGRRRQCGRSRHAAHASRARRPQDPRGGQRTPGRAEGDGYRSPHRARGSGPPGVRRVRGRAPSAKGSAHPRHAARRRHRLRHGRRPAQELGSRLRRARGQAGDTRAPR